MRRLNIDVNISTVDEAIEVASNLTMRVLSCRGNVTSDVIESGGRSAAVMSFLDRSKIRTIENAIPIGVGNCAEHVQLFNAFLDQIKEQNLELNQQIGPVTFHTVRTENSNHVFASVEKRGAIVVDPWLGYVGSKRGYNSKVTAGPTIVRDLFESGKKKNTPKKVGVKPIIFVGEVCSNKKFHSN